MQDLLPQLIRLNIPFIFLLLIGAVATLIAFYQYRKTTPELSKSFKYILITIRAIIFFLVILLFFSPSFFLTYNKTIKPKFALFIDNSKSMSYEINDYKRWLKTMDAVQSVIKIIPSNAQLIQFTFNSSIDTVTSTEITASEKSTNFNPLIGLLKRDNFNKAVIVTDGNHTESKYPIESEWPFDTKIYTVGIGAISSGIDLVINNVIYQPVTYVDQENLVETQIKAVNLDDNSSVQIKYYLNNKLIQQKQINLPSGSFNRSVKLSNIHNKAGLNKIRIEIDVIDNETNVLNNRYTFVQNVLNSRIRIGLFAGSPSYESKFISFLLKQIEDFEVFDYIEKKSGQFFNRADLNELDNLDLLILCGFPGRYTSANTLNRVLNYVRQKQPSLLVYLNQHTNLQKLLQIRPWLPYEQLPGKIKSREITVNNPLTNSMNPSLFIFDRKDVNQEFWTKTPPITIYYSGGLIRDGVKSLLSGSDSRNQFPLILLNEQKNHRSVVLNGEGFWKWHFLLQSNQRISAGYQKFLTNMLRWANDRAKLKPVILNSEKNVAHLGESVRINGYIYDASFQPMKDGELIVQADWNQQEFSIEAVNDSTGNYLIEFVPPGEGKYTITAKGFKQGIELGSDQLEIEVIPIEKEFIHIDQNVDFLKKLAHMGNGLYVDASQIDTLASALIEPDKVVLKDRVIDIWYHPVLLALIILLITAEWILRKRLGLV